MFFECTVVTHPETACSAAEVVSRKSSFVGKLKSHGVCLFCLLDSVVMLIN